MSNPNISLTKICSHCGQRKPLTAFLQLSGQQGSTYGNVCSSCRKTINTSAPKESDESTSSTSGLRIDAKTKVQGEVDKRELRKQKEEGYSNEREKQDKEQTQQVQKNIHFAKDQRKHRDTFLARPLDISKKSQQRDSTPVFGGEEHKAEAAEINFAKGPVEMRVAGQTKQHTSVFNSFKKWLGNAAPQNAGDKVKSIEKSAMDVLTDLTETFRPRTKK